jgi:UDP-N-acetylglucosamine 2-epimerase (non-hydrolysing)
VAAGTALLVGHDEETLVSAACRLLEDEACYATMAKAISPYGDGHAGNRIADVLGDWLANKGKTAIAG